MFILLHFGPHNSTLNNEKVSLRKELNERLTSLIVDDLVHTTSYSPFKEKRYMTCPPLHKQETYNLLHSSSISSPKDIHV